MTNQINQNSFKKPVNIEDYLWTAFSMRIDEKYPQALEYLNKFIINYFDDYRPFELMADNYLMLWEFKKMAKPLKTALMLNKESASGNYLKAASLMWQSKHKEAIPFLETALKGLPNDVEILEKLWICKFLSAETDIELEKSLYLLKRTFILSWEAPNIAETLWLFLVTEWRFEEWMEYIEKSELNDLQKQRLQKFKELYGQNNNDLT